MSDDRLETQYRTLVSQQDLLVQVQGVLGCVGQELKPFAQASSSKLEALWPLIGNSCHLPFH